MREPSALAPLREELHLKLALSRKHDLPRLLELVVEQERICLRRLEEHADATSLEELTARNATWPTLSAAMVRDAEAEHLQATASWLRRVGAAMRAQLGAAAPA